MTELFDPISIDDQAFLLAMHAPQGSLWKNLFNKDDDLGKIFLGLAVEFYRFQVIEQELFGEMNIRKANDLLIDWEKSVGLPDSCFVTTVPTELRRQQVEQKFAKFGGVQKKEDFIRVAQFFGIAIDIKSGKEEGSIVDLKQRSHTFFVDVLFSALQVDDFPLPFPIPFSRGPVEFLQCIFNALAPANVEIILTNLSATSIAFVTEGGAIFSNESGTDFLIPE